MLTEQNKIILKNNIKQLLIELRCYSDFQFWTRGFWVLNKSTVETLVKKSEILKDAFSQYYEIQESFSKENEINTLLTLINTELSLYLNEYEDRTSFFDLKSYAKIRTAINTLSNSSNIFLKLENINWLDIDEINSQKDEFDLLEAVSKIYTAEIVFTEDLLLTAPSKKKIISSTLLFMKNLLKRNSNNVELRSQQVLQ